MEELEKELEAASDKSRKDFLDKSRDMFEFLEYKYKNNQKVLEKIRIGFLLMVFKILLINFIPFIYHNEINFDDPTTISDKLREKFNIFMDKFSCRQNRERIISLLEHLVNSFIFEK